VPNSDRLRQRDEIMFQIFSIPRFSWIITDVEERGRREPRHRAPRSRPGSQA